MNQGKIEKADPNINIEQWVLMSKHSSNIFAKVSKTDDGSI